MSKTISDQIADLEATRASKAALAIKAMQKSVDEARTTDTAEAEEVDTITDEIKAIDADLVRLRAIEKLVGEKAAPVDGGNTKAAGLSREGVTVKNTEKLEPGIEFARYAMCIGAAKGDKILAHRIAQSQYPQNERVVKTLDLQANGGNLEMLQKADVAAGTTTNATWLAPLVDFQNFAGDFVEFLRPQTIIGKFGQGGVPSLNRIPFNVRITGQTSGGAGYWVGEGAPKPLTKFDFNATELRWAKVANIAVLTEESIRFSNPSAERLVRDALAAALIERLDIDFVDPGKAAVTNVSPASITNGVTPIAPSGSGTLANIRTDIKALWAPFIAANNPPTSAVYIMSATTALALSLIVESGSGMPAFPGITMNGGTFNGVPVIVSEYLDNSAGSAGSIVILANARDIWLADDGQVNVDASREASLQMMDNPTNNSATPTHTTMVSMFQTNSVAIRAERFINWAKRRSSAVSWLDGVNWGTGV
jgi:HK97 family phage major capsid protein